MAVLSLSRITGPLPDDLTVLRQDARAEGHGFLDRLALEFASGANRFDRAGEALLVAHVGDVLAGIGGITIDPWYPGALRMRRFYVLTAHRRLGIARVIALELLNDAPRPITLNASAMSFPFWESLGFIPVADQHHTHRMA
jgi:GNAT superfamily N-acetyltransferase